MGDYGLDDGYRAAEERDDDGEIDNLELRDAVLLLFGRDLRALRGQLDVALREASDARDDRQVRDELKVAIMEVDFLGRRSREVAEARDEDRAYDLLAIAGSLQSRLVSLGMPPVAADAAGAVQNAAATVSNAVKNAMAAIWSVFKQALHHLWQLICHLATPKEWSLSGDAGLSVLGLANVGAEITFGP